MGSAAGASGGSERDARRRRERAPASEPWAQQPARAAAPSGTRGEGVSLDSTDTASPVVPAPRPAGGPAVPLRVLVAHNLRRLREAAGAGLDDVVRAAWGEGLDWT